MVAKLSVKQIKWQFIGIGQLKKANTGFISRMTGKNQLKLFAFK
jgi:hypothetical protein